MQLTPDIFKLHANPAALTRLAAGSAIVIATLLSLPDAIAFTAAVNTPMVWIIRLLGIWFTAAILWFTGFLVAILLVQSMSGPISISKQGIRLWRSGQLLRWDAIEAIAMDEQNFFASLCFLKKPVYKLTLYVRNGKNSLIPSVVPSFYFPLLSLDY